MSFRNIFFVLLLLPVAAVAAEREEPIAFGDMNQWYTRQIKESGIIGGDVKTLYELAPQGFSDQRDAYVNLGGSPWASSNVMAKVSGIYKTNCSVFPYERSEGNMAARLSTRIEQVKVLGIVNITVLAAGSIFLGEMVEPIKGTKDPHSYLNSGIPFRERPKAVRFDYKVKLSGEPQRVRITGFSPRKQVEGLDMPTCVLLLQKRWETKDGEFEAIRVGTVVVRYTEDEPWCSDATYEIIYGDARESETYDESMALNYEQRFSKNSEGDNVAITELGWGCADDMPTHLVMQFSSSHGGAYIGSPGNEFYVDNVRLVY